MKNQLSASELSLKIREIVAATTPENAIESTKRVYRLKRKHFPGMALWEIRPLMEADYCPLCRAFLMKKSPCPLGKKPFCKGKCVHEWLGAFAAAYYEDEIFRNGFDVAFRALYNKIMALK